MQACEISAPVAKERIHLDTLIESLSRMQENKEN